MQFCTECISFVHKKFIDNEEFPPPNGIYELRFVGEDDADRYVTFCCKAFFLFVKAIYDSITYAVESITNWKSASAPVMNFYVRNKARKHARKK